MDPTPSEAPEPAPPPTSAHARPAAAPGDLPSAGPNWSPARIISLALLVIGMFVMIYVVWVLAIAMG